MLKPLTMRNFCQTVKAFLATANCFLATTNRFLVAANAFLATVKDFLVAANCFLAVDFFIFLQFTSMRYEFLSDCERFSCYCKSFTCYCEKFSCNCKCFSCRCDKFRPLNRHNLSTCVHRPKCLDLCVISPTFCKHIWSLLFKGSNLFLAPNKLAKWLTLLTRRN